MGCRGLLCMLRLLHMSSTVASSCRWLSSRQSVKRSLYSLVEPSPQPSLQGEELSDVLLYLVRLADVCGLDLAACACAADPLLLDAACCRVCAYLEVASMSFGFRHWIRFAADVTLVQASHAPNISTSDISPACTDGGIGTRCQPLLATTAKP